MNESDNPDRSDSGDPTRHRRDARNPVRDRRGPDLVTVGAGAGTDGGVDHKVDVPVLDRLDYVRGALAQFVDRLLRNRFLEKVCNSAIYASGQNAPGLSDIGQNLSIKIQ